MALWLDSGDDFCVPRPLEKSPRTRHGVKRRSHVSAKLVELLAEYLESRDRLVALIVRGRSQLRQGNVAVQTFVDETAMGIYPYSYSFQASGASFTTRRGSFSRISSVGVRTDGGDGRLYGWNAGRLHRAARRSYRRQVRAAATTTRRAEFMTALKKEIREMGGFRAA